MKICLVTSFPPSRDALNEYGFHIASELQRIPGIELTVLGDQYSPEQSELEGFSVKRCWKFNSLSNPWRLLRAIKQEKPDVVWFNLGFASFGGTPPSAFLGIATPALARMAGFYTHVTLHQLMETVNLEDAGVRFPKLYQWGGALATHLVLFANSVSVMLPAYRSVLVEKYGRGSVYVRRHGIFSARPEYPDLALRGNPEHRILAFGKWGTYKRLEPMIEAFKEVSRKIPEARLVIAGTDHPKTPGYLQSIREKLASRSDVIFTGYVAEDDIPQLFQSSSVAVLPYTSSAGSSGIAHLACTYGLPVVASDIPDFRRLAEEEGLAIDFFPPGQTGELAQHLIDLLENRDRQIEMAMQNVSAALRMSMPEIIRQYLSTFELRQELEQMRSLSSLRKIPRWMPMRDILVRRNARKTFLRSESRNASAAAAAAGNSSDPAEVVYVAASGPAAHKQRPTGTE
ncbi:MAG TPA: glycosyltransferase [Terriglobales bacterium]|jgi:glycosyltransferase involved in cell wall biosynthesis|nr:glycosyltransferase [Terriglobales bacterium]